MTLINLGRIKRAVFLDEKVYSEIAEDKGALLQAIIVVLLASVIGGILPIIVISRLFYFIIPMLILSVAGLSLAGWFIGSGVMHIVAKLLGGKADFVSYFKAIGFARVPAALWVIPSIGWIIGPVPGVLAIILYISWLIGAIWAFTCYFTATKVVHRLSTGKAIIAAVVVPITLMVLIIWMNGIVYSRLERGNIGDIVIAFAIGALTLLSLFSLI